MFFFLNTCKYPLSVVVDHAVKKIDDFLQKSDFGGHSESKIIFDWTANGDKLNTSYKLTTGINYAINLYRKFFLHRNEQETIICQNQQLIIIQVVLNQLHLDLLPLTELVKLSEKISEQKLDSVSSIHRDVSFDDNNIESILGSSPNKSGNFDKIFSGYKKFLDGCNSVDIADVLKTLIRESLKNSELSSLLFDPQSVFLVTQPATIGHVSAVEEKLLTFMMQGAECFEVTPSTSFTEGLLLTDVTVDVAKCQGDNILCRFKPSVDCCTIPSVVDHVGYGTKSNCSPSEVYVEHLILSYLSLLVNSRSELALATVVNIPDRGIDHHSFIKIKHASAGKNLSMYQTILSYVMRTRLGGKGYMPSHDDPMSSLVKGLSEFIDLFNRMHSILEEEEDARSAITRLMNCIKTVLTKSSNTSSAVCQPMKRSVFEQAASKILLTCDSCLEKVKGLNQDGITPTRLINEGASMNGRRTLRLIRNILDTYSSCYQHYSSCLDGNSHCVLLTDTVLTQSISTPLRSLSGLAAKFRTPDDLKKKDELCMVKACGSKTPEKIVRSSGEFVLRSRLKRHLGSKQNESILPEPKPLFFEVPIYSPESNKENIPPEELLNKRKNHSSVSKADLHAPKKVKLSCKSSSKKQPATSKKVKNNMKVDVTQPTLKTFFR